MNRENDKWGWGLCFTGMMLNYIQSCHLESIVLPECWQTSAQCGDCILPFSFLICFSSPILRVTQHNHSEPFIISPVISLFLFFCGTALIKHLIASTSQQCVIPDRNTKKHTITPRGPVPPLRYSCRKEGTIPSTSSSFLFPSLSSVCYHNDRGCKDVFCNVHCAETLSGTVGYCSLPHLIVNNEGLSYNCMCNL